MSKKNWTVQLGDGQHVVEVERGSFSGKLTIRADGQVVQQQRPQGLYVGGDYPFQIGARTLVLHTRTHALGQTFDLSIDGRSVETGQEVKPLEPLPRWAWLFIAGCFIIPILTLGGALPAGIGAAGGFACAIISRDPSRTARARMALSAGVVVGCWVLVFLVLRGTTGLLSGLNSPPAEWQEFTSTEGGFSVLLPGTPKEQIQPTDSPVGSLDVHIFSWETRAEAYLVSYIDYPAEVVRQNDLNVMLENGRDGAVSGVDGTLQDDQPISIDGYPGREFTVLVDAASRLQPQLGVYKARIYLVDQRFYQLVVVTSEARATSPEATKFLDSFKLLSQ